MTKPSHISGNILARCVTHGALNAPERIGQALARSVRPDAPVHVLLGRFAEHGKVIEAVPARCISLIAKLPARIVDGLFALARAKHLLWVNAILAANALKNVRQCFVIVNKVRIVDHV